MGKQSFRLFLRIGCLGVACFAVMLFCVTPVGVSSAETEPYGQEFVRNYVSSVDGVSLPCSIYIPPYGINRNMPVWIDLHALNGPGGIRFDWKEWCRLRGWMLISPWGRNYRGVWADGIEPAGTTPEPSIFEDFSGGAAGWMELTGAWGWDSGDRSFEQADTSDSWKSAVKDGSSGADYAVSVDIQETGASGDDISAAGLVFRRQPNGDCYQVDIASSSVQKLLRLYRFQGGTWTPLAIEDLGSFDIRQKHNLMVSVSGNNIDVRLDGGIRVLDKSYTYHQDTSEYPDRQDEAFSSGAVGLVSYGGSHRFDNFRVQNDFLYGEKDVLDTVEQFMEDFSDDQNYRADPTRVYLSGFSIGGTGAWNIGLHYPDMFTAVHPSTGTTDMYEEYSWMDGQRHDRTFDPEGAPPRYYAEQDFLYNESTEALLGGEPGSAVDQNSRMHEFSARYIIENSLNTPYRIEHTKYDTIAPNTTEPMWVWLNSMEGLINSTRDARADYAHSQYIWDRWKDVPGLTNCVQETALYGEDGTPPADPEVVWDEARYDQQYWGGGHGSCYYDWLMVHRHIAFIDRAFSQYGALHDDPDEVAYKTYDDLRNRAWWLTVGIADPDRDSPGLARVKRDRANNAVQVHVKNVRTTILDLARMGMSLDPGRSLRITVDNATVESEPLSDTSKATDLRLAGEWDTAAVYPVRVNGAAVAPVVTPGSMTIPGVRSEPPSEVLVDLPQTQGNMLANAGFEQGADSWETSVTGGGHAVFEENILKAFAHTGAGSLRIKDAAAAGPPYTASYTSERVPVVPGRQYTLGAFVKTRALAARNRVFENGRYNTDEQHNSWARAGLLWTDADGAAISESDSSGRTNTCDWVPLEVTAAAPPNAAYARVVLKAESPDAAGSTGSAWFDDVSLRRGYGVSGTVPALSVVSPGTATNSGPVSITLDGSGFSSGATARLLKAGEAPINGAVGTVTADRITCVFDLTGAQVGDWDVEVTNPNGERAVLPGRFLVYPPTGPLSVTGISPGSGTAGSTVPVTLSGTGFVPGAAVTLEASGVAPVTASDVNCDSASSLTCTLNLTGAAAGDYDVVVKSPDGLTSRKTGAFRVNAAAPACGTGGASGVLMFGLAMGFLAIAGLGSTKARAGSSR